MQRGETHRIIDITSELGKCSFTRNSNFPFSLKKSGEKVYKNKKAELKIEKYGSRM
jgi:hypothetical protein